MMSRFWTITLVISLVANGLFCFYFFDVEHLFTPPDNRPPSNPFEVKSTITFEGLVADGYRFCGMPCGQVQYCKTMGDTTIQYEVGMVGELVVEFETDDLFLEDTVTGMIEEQEREPIDTAEARRERQEEQDANPYYPFNQDDWFEMMLCCNNINWHIYSIKMPVIDSLGIVDFVRKNNGIILSQGSHWNTREGGDLVVLNPDNDLIFICNIRPEYSMGLDQPGWKLSVSGVYPDLHQKKRNSELEFMEDDNLFRWISKRL